MTGSSKYSSSNRHKSARCAANLNQLASLLENQYHSPKIGSRRHRVKTPNKAQDPIRIKSESGKQPVDTPNTPQDPKIKIEPQKHPVETPNTSREQNSLDHERQEDHLNSHFSCPFCPKKYGSIQALAGHQNAHREGILLKNHHSKAVQKCIRENYINGKKFRGNDPIHRHRHHHHHGDDDNFNLGNHVDDGHHQDIKGKNHSSSSDDDIIYSPKPLRAFIPGDSQHIRPFYQGNNHSQPSDGIFLSPKSVTTLMEVDDDGDEPSVWDLHIPRPPPPPPPLAPSSSCSKPHAQTLTSNIHHHCSSSSKFPFARVSRQVASIDLNMSNAYHLQDNLPFPPGFGYDKDNIIYLKEVMGEDHYEAYLDLNLMV